MTLKIVRRATQRQIRDAVVEQPPDIVHFVGHSICHNGRNDLALVDGDTGETWPVDDERFFYLLGYTGYRDPRLISLVTCRSAHNDDQQSSSNIAPKLVRRGAAAVLSMQYRANIETTWRFFRRFYAAIAGRNPVDRATQIARRDIWIYLGHDNREFAAPVLYMGVEDGEIF